MTRRERIYLSLLFVALAAAAAAMTRWSRVSEGTVRALEIVQSTGPWGPVLFVVVYVVACLVFAPGSLLTIGAGFLFGLGVGTVVSSIGSTLGAGAAFLLARTLLRSWVQRKFAADPRVRALDEGVGQHGFKIVLLARLSPALPFNLLNLAFGLTTVSLKDYMLASWIGMLPGALLYVYIGTAAKSLTDLAQGRGSDTPATMLLFVLGLAATIALTVVLTRLARRSLHELTTRPSDRLTGPPHQPVA